MTDARLRNTALLVAGCFFMENLDGTIVITAAPRIGRALHVPSTSVGLVIAAYMVTLAVLIPLSGWLAARWGARTRVPVGDRHLHPVLAGLLRPARRSPSWSSSACSRASVAR